MKNEKKLEGELLIPKSIPKSDIAIYVVGNEMSKFGIKNGEYALCCYPNKEQENVRNCVGKIVACIVNSVGLLRKVIKTKDEDVLLISGDDSVPKIKVTQSGKEVKVWGIVVAAYNEFQES